MAAPYLTADATRPAQKTVAITPSDATRYPAARGIYVGGTGNINVIHPDGSTFVYVAVPGGMFPVQSIGVMLTNTTATNLGASY